MVEDYPALDAVLKFANSAGCFVTISLIMDGYPPIWLVNLWSPNGPSGGANSLLYLGLWKPPAGAWII
ncbi:hypothetical protein WYO_5478 [Methylobacterium sp. GXF4]|nr:hypothetical protein WYO_5478 [Methylobacterium sp. GXF4]